MRRGTVRPVSVARAFFWTVCVTICAAAVVGWAWGVVANVMHTGFGR